MSGLSYDGVAPSQPGDVADRVYVNSIPAAWLTQQQVDDLITAGFAPYVTATKTYVDSQDTLNANQAYIDGTGGVNPNGGDAVRLHLSQVNVNNGVPGLDSTGRTQVSRVNLASTQRYLKGLWSPSAYNSLSVSTSGEASLYSCAVADPSPGRDYRLFVTGQVDAKTTVDGYPPVINVRVGSTSGQVIAQGLGNSEAYQNTALWSVYPNAGSYTYNIPSTVSIFDVILLGGGAGGQCGEALFIGGNGGFAGQWSRTTIVRGVDIPWGTTSVSINVGGGGAAGVGGFGGPGGPGGGTTASASGMSTLGAAGGQPNNAVGVFPGGAGAGNLQYEDQTLFGGGAQGSVGAGGNGPGGAGAGGAGGLFFAASNGGPGAGGSAWIIPDVANNFGTCSIIPSSMGTQTPLRGDTTLYVTLTAGATVVATALKPSLCVMAVPA